MQRLKICTVIVNNNPATIREAGAFADLFEVRIDLIGAGWQEVPSQLKKPWLACNRRPAEGGQGEANETERIDKLLRAIELGASMADIELSTGNLPEIVPLIKKGAKCIVSFHDFHKTPPFEDLKAIVQRQIEAGADICKIVTTAQSFADNTNMLRLITEFPRAKIVAFAMGPLGTASRILCPLVGGEFTYAAIEKGQESAPGQITAGELRHIYDMIRK